MELDLFTRILIFYIVLLVSLAKNTGAISEEFMAVDPTSVHTA